MGRKSDPNRPKKPSIFSKEYRYPQYDGERGNPDQWAESFCQRFTNAEIKEILKDESPWSILGLQPGATREEIKKAFRQKAIETHPDRNPGLDRSVFQKVNAAYQELMVD
jgi:DnaJ-class molecular chaperone